MQRHRKLLDRGHTGPVLLIITVLLTNLVVEIGQVLFYQVAFGAVLAAALALRIWNVFHLSLLLFIMSLGNILFPNLILHIPAAKSLLPLAISTSIVFFFFRSHMSLSWARKGKMDHTLLILICVTGIVSIAALLLWAFWTDNLGIGVRMAQEFSHYPRWLVLGLGVPLFALVNAFAEEAVFRGIMQTALSSAFRRLSAVLILQASAFAAFHFSGGFPNGYAGYLMTFVYGIMLGYLRERSQGLLAPYSAHVIADLTIGCFLWFYAL